MVALSLLASDVAGAAGERAGKRAGEGWMTGKPGSLDFRAWVDAGGDRTECRELLSTGGDGWLGGDCDSAAHRLAEELGWGEELRELVDGGATE